MDGWIILDGSMNVLMDVSDNTYMCMQIWINLIDRWFVGQRNRCAMDRNINHKKLQNIEEQIDRTRKLGVDPKNVVFAQRSQHN